MKPICIIPARGNSKGVPKKNIRKIMGKPLIAYTIEKSIKSNIFSHVIVSTEDKEIAAISRKFGAKVPFMRPKYLATDNTRADDYLLHAVKKLLDLGFEFDIVVWRDCTVPFIRNKDIKKSIKLLKEKKANLVIGVYHQHLNPYYNIVEYTKTKNLKLCKISLFFIALVFISFSLIFPAVPRKVHIVLSESGVINIKQVPVGNVSFFLE